MVIQGLERQKVCCDEDAFHSARPKSMSRYPGVGPFFRRLPPKVCIRHETYPRN